MTHADTAPWYPIATMRRHRITVRVQGAGYECLAIVRDHPTAKRPWWLVMAERATFAGRHLLPVEPLAPYGVAAHVRAPMLWQPLAAGHWPEPLPAPVRDAPRPPGQHPPPPDEEPEDPTQPGDGWPYPGLRLGQRVPPSSIEECEARLLRALRTSASRETGHVGLDRRATCADIPAEMIKIALKFAHWEAIMRGDVKPETHAVRSGWTPLRRDIEDWTYALEWLRAPGCGGTGQEVLIMRAADPPWSFRGAAERLSTRRKRITGQAVHAAYWRVVEAAFEGARSQ